MVLNPAEKPVGLSLYLEGTIGNGEAEVEEKLILGQRHGDWKWAFNLVHATEWEEDFEETEGELEADFGLVVEDALVEGKDLYVKVNAGYWNSEFIVKASPKKGEAYSQWENGTAEMPLKVYRSTAKQKQGYTYRISTSGRFVEYWTGGKLVLHLEKVQ